jgi:hypothetical protein
MTNKQSILNKRLKVVFLSLGCDSPVVCPLRFD